LKTYLFTEVLSKVGNPSSEVPEMHRTQICI